MTNDLPDINISEEVNKSGLWKSLEANSSNPRLSQEEAAKKAKEEAVKRYVKVLTTLALGNPVKGHYDLFRMASEILFYSKIRNLMRFSEFRS